MVSAYEISGLLVKDHGVSVLTPGSTIAIDPKTGGIFTLVPAQAATITTTSVTIGQRLVLVITTSGSTSYTLTFGTNFKSTGTLATGTTTAKVFTIEFLSDGTNYNEIARTTAM